MTAKKTGIIEGIGSAVKGAGENIENWGYVKKNKKTNKVMKKKMVSDRTERNYVNAYGQQSFNRASFKDLGKDKEEKKLGKMKKTINKKYGYL